MDWYEPLILIVAVAVVGPLISKWVMRKMGNRTLLDRWRETHRAKPRH